MKVINVKYVNFTNWWFYQTFAADWIVESYLIPRLFGDRLHIRVANLHSLTYGAWHLDVLLFCYGNTPHLLMGEDNGSAEQSSAVLDL